jgi:hypothetical protein
VKELTRVPPPKPSFLDFQSFWKVIGGKKVYRSSDGSKLYVWDSFRRGYHLGVVDALEGKFIKPAVKGRKIDV